MAMARTNIFLGQRRQRDDGAEFREADSPRRFDEILHDLFERKSITVEWRLTASSTGTCQEL
jgi:hypothetical protein